MSPKMLPLTPLSSEKTNSRRKQRPAPSGSPVVESTSEIPIWALPIDWPVFPSLKTLFQMPMMRPARGPRIISKIPSPTLASLTATAKPTAKTAAPIPYDISRSMSSAPMRFPYVADVMFLLQWNVQN